MLQDGLLRPSRNGFFSGRPVKAVLRSGSYFYSFCPDDQSVDDRSLYFLRADSSHSEHHSSKSTACPPFFVLPPSWGVYKHVGDGVDFGHATQYRKINEFACCAWSTPTWQQAGMTATPGRLGEWGSPGSMHVGGCQVALGDGSVRFISENIDTTTRVRLGLIADGQVIGEF